jgi:hypothetical protein
MCASWSYQTFRSRSQVFLDLEATIDETDVSQGDPARGCEFDSATGQRRVGSVQVSRLARLRAIDGFDRDAGR